LKRKFGRFGYFKFQKNLIVCRWFSIRNERAMRRAERRWERVVSGFINEAVETA
jgi:hypothetical protein